MSYRKPWDAEGISRATWYRRRHRETAGETDRETEASETVETKAGIPPWTISDVDAARRADRYRAARKERGEFVANRGLRWDLQNAGVPYERLQQEVDRIRQMAGC